MMNSNLHRDEEAVSAAVATVLLFGGVISIIGLMLLSLVPVIQELEGSLKRSDMQSQMEIMNHEVNLLSESGLPGDSSEVELIPVDGTLRWDRIRGGMWYSASWYEDTTFRIRGALDLNREVEIRHPESHVQAICYEDMRLGPDRHFLFTPNNNADFVLVTPKHGLSIPLGPVIVEQSGNEYPISIGEVLRLTTDSVISSSHDLSGLELYGNGGATLVPPVKTNPVSGMGQNWAIPIPSGNTTVEVMSKSDMLVQYSIDGTLKSQVVIQPEGIQYANSWVKEFQTTSDTLLEIITDVDAQVMIIHEGIGQTMIMGQENSFISKNFIAPKSEGNITFFNPNENSATVTWRNGGYSIPGNQTITIEWPPVGIENSTILKSDEDIMVKWSIENNGAFVLPAIDTGQLTGMKYIEDSGDSITNETSAHGDYMTKHILNGDNGIVILEDDGDTRCISIDKTASGWISTILPWDTMNGIPEGQIVKAWQSGKHPASIEITLIGSFDNSNYAVLSTSWAFHISRLTYEFDTSITGLEVAWSSGAIVTNHPEMQPTILEGPTDRQGPGPRFSVTVPSLHPTSTSVEGSGYMNLNMELTMRQSLASCTAHDVRRGWIGPYGDAVASWSSEGLESSNDWIVNPGKFDQLKDYTGWVPVPSHGPSESIWHTAGEPIQFNLQISSIDVEIAEVGS